MSEQQLKNLIRHLNETLENTEQLDPATRELVIDLDKDINRLLDQEDDWWDYDGVNDKAVALQAHFRTEHPVADRFIREIMDILAKVGI